MPILDVFKKKKEKKKKAPEKKKVEKKVKREVKEKKEAVKPKKQIARIDSSSYKALLHPIISEKATFLGGENKYVFEVSKKTNKREIAQAIKDVYGVEPIKIHVVNVKGKERRYGRYTGRTKNRKKAIVTLKEGQAIQVYEGV